MTGVGGLGLGIVLGDDSRDDDIVAGANVDESTVDGELVGGVV